MDFDNSFLVNLIPANILESGYLVAAVLLLIFPILAVVVVVSPALTNFIMNLIFPILMNWSRGIWCGVVFYFIHLILLIILLVFRNLPVFPMPRVNYPFPTSAIDPLVIAGLLAGFVLSCSVTLLRRLVANMRRKKL